jgi:hypothetical protein
MRLGAVAVRIGVNPCRATGIFFKPRMAVCKFMPRRRDLKCEGICGAKFHAKKYVKIATKLFALEKWRDRNCLVKPQKIAPCMPKGQCGSFVST